jgi:hypothetical protein
MIAVSHIQAATECTLNTIDPLHSELRILDWILFRVCSNEIKQFERI